LGPAAKIAPALLCLLLGVACIGGSGGQLVAKPVEPRPKPAQSPHSGPIPPDAVPDKWRVHCRNRDGSADCQARQSVYRKTTGKLLVAVTVRVPRRFQMPVMHIQLPLNVDIAYGAQLQFGQTPTRSLALRSCTAAGCFAEYTPAEIELASLIKGERLKISVRNRLRATVRIKVSGNGFAEAYAKIKSVAM
jgi:invasion protein IalB